MFFLLPILLVILMALRSTTAFPTGPAIEMNWYDDGGCDNTHIYMPTYIYGNTGCTPFNSSSLLVNYYNGRCDRK
jgi:hypothetical protein